MLIAQMNGAGLLTAAAFVATLIEKRVPAATDTALVMSKAELLPVVIVHVSAVSVASPVRKVQT